MNTQYKTAKDVSFNPAHANMSVLSIDTQSWCNGLIYSVQDGNLYYGNSKDIYKVHFEKVKNHSNESCITPKTGPIKILYRKIAAPYSPEKPSEVYEDAIVKAVKNCTTGIEYTRMRSGKWYTADEFTIVAWLGDRDCVEHQY